MKARRQAMILELISANDIDTQEELLRRMDEAGLHVTQATISRDIRELRLAKTQGANGVYKYSVGGNRGGSDMSFKFHSVFTESVENIDCAENIVVIKCYTGMANAACAALDSLNWGSVVGTIAGDDTIFCVTRTKLDAINFTAQLKRLENKKQV